MSGRPFPSWAARLALRFAKKSTDPLVRDVAAHVDEQLDDDQGDDKQPRKVVVTVEPKK